MADAIRERVRELVEAGVEESYAEIWARVEMEEKNETVF